MKNTNFIKKKIIILFMFRIQILEKCKLQKEKIIILFIQGGTHSICLNCKIRSRCLTKKNLYLYKCNIMLYIRTFKKIFIPTRPFQNVQCSYKRPWLYFYLCRRRFSRSSWCGSPRRCSTPSTSPSTLPRTG